MTNGWYAIFAASSPETRRLINKLIPNSPGITIVVALLVIVIFVVKLIRGETSLRARILNSAWVLLGVILLIYGIWQSLR
jgi:uncharacterized membrane protein YozB (DUF420 family)